MRNLLQKIAEPPADEIEAIRQYLLEMLNTIVGGSACAPEFGTLDHTHPVHDWDHTIKDLKRSIQRSIEAYEHRLEHVRVIHELVPHDPRQLNFQIRARLASSGEAVQLHLRNDPRLAGRIDYWMI